MYIFSANTKTKRSGSTIFITLPGFFLDAIFWVKGVKKGEGGRFLTPPPGLDHTGEILGQTKKIVSLV